MMDMLFHYLSGSTMDKIVPSQFSACLKIFVSYIKQKGEECSVILKELNNTQYYKRQGRPKFSNILIRLAIMLRCSSCQTYKLLLKELALPSMSVLKN